MTDQIDNEPAFTDNVDPYQARNGRREALQFAMPLATGKGAESTAETLIGYAAQIDAYLEDGSVPNGGSKAEDDDLPRRVSGILRGGETQSIHR